MSVTPFVPQLPPTAPTGMAVSTGPGAGDPTAAAGFAALVASMLGNPAGTSTTPAAVTPAAVTPAAETEELSEAEDLPEAEETDTTDTAEDVEGGSATTDPEQRAPEASAQTAALAGLAAMVAGVVPLLARPLALPTVVGPAAEGGADTGSTQAAAVPADPAPVEGVTIDPALPAVVDPALTPVTDLGPGGDAAAGAAAPASPAAPAPDPAPPAAVAPNASAPAPQVAPLTPTTSVAPAGAPTPVAANPVTAQVIPEVTRLVSQGNGIHRLTMTLKPEALGEVRVTLTVHDGEVRVRLAAGDEAQRALVEGAPELRRVLELTGASDPRVVVRDLAQPPSSQSASSQTTPLSADTGGQRGDTAATGHGRGGPHDQHAGTRGGTTARDGLSDGAHALRPEPVRNARTTGVDLTM